MRDSSGHNPCPRASRIEKCGFTLPPRFVFFSERSEPFATVLCITLDEFQTCFLPGKRWRANINCQHRAKPQIFADALMHHLLPDNAHAWITCSRTHRKVSIREFTPHT